MKVVSGGQTGVDRAALDTALAYGLPIGGWCPKGRRAEDGVISRRYGLRETESADYAERTRRNVRDSDATLILAYGGLEGGTALTAEEARRLEKPLLALDLREEPDPARVCAWIGRGGIRVLNVAGPRASEAPGIYEAARSFLHAVLDRLPAEEREEPV